MRNDLAAPPAGINGAGGCLRSSEPVSLSPVPTEAASLLEEAVDLLVVHMDFAAALDRCEKGCESLTSDPENEDCDNSAETKCSLCIVGIQALAEMNRWREVLSWLLRYYQIPEHLPPKILELCILLYSKVKEPHVMVEVGRDWLTNLANQSLPMYGSLVDLHLSHVLLPLGKFGEAEELVQGCKTFGKEQQLEALRTVSEKSRQWVQQQEEGQSKPEEQQTTAREKLFSSVSHKVLTLLTVLRRVLGSVAGHVCSIPYKKTLLAAFMLYLVVVRLDPAAPTSLPFLYRLIQLFHQAQAAVFSPRYRPPVQG
uniref:Peroxisomal biosis factor 26 n=1 Tax=Sphenodon punctatus TaxID=8508 RepID=A0A8D0GUL9_SPHPU